MTTLYESIEAAEARCLNTALAIIEENGLLGNLIEGARQDSDLYNSAHPDVARAMQSEAQEKLTRLQALLAECGLPDHDYVDGWKRNLNHKAGSIDTKGYFSEGQLSTFFPDDVEIDFPDDVEIDE